MTTKHLRWHIITVLVCSIILFTALDSDVLAQRHGVYLGLGSEVTVSGNFIVFQGGVELNRHRIGLVYERRFDEEQDPFASESYNFKALLYEYTFLREKNIQLGAMLRGGLSNDDFVVLVPAITTSYIFNDYFKINLVTGIRAEKPALALNVFFNLPFKKHEFPYSNHKR